MAKTKLKWGRQQGGPQRKLPIKVTIQRRAAAGPNDQGGIMACVASGVRSSAVCATANSPKEALAKAFEKMANRLHKRPKGAFMGYRQSRKDKKAGKPKLELDMLTEIWRHKETPSEKRAREKVEKRAERAERSKRKEKNMFDL